jgi:hypothetical protein
MHSERVSQSFNLGLEILKGCGYSCAGCTVDKNVAAFDIPEDDARELLSLLTDLKTNDWRLLELKIGPTDIVSAENGFEALRHPVVREIISHFKVVTLNAAMLHDHKLVELAEILDEVAPGKHINIGTPFTLHNLANEKFMGIMKKRLAYFKGLLKKAQFTRLYATVNIESGNLDQFTDEAFSLLRNYDFGAGIHKVVEFPFVNARQGFDNLLHAEVFKRDVKRFSDFVKTKVNTHEFVPLIPKANDGYEYTYRTGKLYSTIVMVENVTLYNERFELARPWTGQALMADREETYINNLIRYSEHPECGDCCFLDNCSRCDIPRLMDETSSQECLFGMKNRYDLFITEHQAAKT